MRLLITGVAGFIGSNVAAEALSRGFFVLGVDNLSTGRRSNIPVGVEFAEMNTGDVTAEMLLSRGITGIVHIAGQNGAAVSHQNPVWDADNNVLQTVSLHFAAELAGVSVFVYASSVAIYGEGFGRAPFVETDSPKPLSPYGVGKASAEMYGKLFQERNPDSVYVALRLHNIYGPGQDISTYEQGIVSIFAGQLVNFGKIEVKGSPNRLRDLTFISDCVDCFLRALEVREPKSYFLNVCTGAGIAVKEIIQELLNWRGGGEVVWGEQDPADPLSTIGNPQKCSEVLGWKAKIQFQEGLSRTLQFIETTEEENR